MRKVIAVMALVGAFFCSFSTSAARAADHAGLFMELKFGGGSGDHQLDYIGHGVQASLYNMNIRTDGLMYGVNVGYRFPIGKTALTFGPVLGVQRGTLSGTVAWTPVAHTAASVHFLSETVLTAGLQLGVGAGNNWFLYGEYGVVAANMALQLNGRYGRQIAAWDSNGWVIGKRLALGAQRRIGTGGWYWGATIERSHFSPSVPITVDGQHHGHLKALVRDTSVFVVIGKQW